MQQNSSNLFAIVVGFGKNICYNIYDGYAWKNYGYKGAPDWIVDSKYSFFEKVFVNRKEFCIFTM